MITRNEFKELKADIKDGYYELIDKYDEINDLQLNIYLEDEEVLIHIIDYGNNLEGGYGLSKDDVLNATYERFNSMLNEVYYYNMYDMAE